MLLLPCANSLIQVSKINGFNVQIAHDKKENGGIIIVYLAEKQVKKYYSTMTFTYKKLDHQQALEFAQKFSWSKIKNRMNSIK